MEHGRPLHDAPQLPSPQWGSEAPSANATARTVTGPCCLRGGSVPAGRVHLSGEPTSYDDVALDLGWATPLQRALAAAARAVPGARWSPTASWQRSQGGRAAARAAGSFCADNRYSLVIPCHRIVAANGIGGYGSAGSRAQAPAARAGRRGALSSGSLADDVRAELAAIAPPRRCDRLAEISALFHTAGTVHLRGRGAVSFHLDLASAAVPAARSGFSPSWASRPRSGRIRRAPSTARRATSCTSTGSERTLDTLAQAGVLGDDHLPLERPPGARRGDVPAAVARTFAARSSAAGSLTGPRSPHLEVRTPTVAGVLSCAASRRSTTCG